MVKEKQHSSYAKLRCTWSCSTIVHRISKSIIVNQLDVAREDCVKDDEEGFFPLYIPHGVSCERVPASDALAMLNGFVDAVDPVLYCVVAGAYGTGKRTLCHAFCQEMNKKGWDAISVYDQRQLEQLKNRPCNDKVVVVNYTRELASSIDQYLYSISLQSRSAYLPKVKTDFKTRVILIYQSELLMDDKCSLPLFTQSKHTNVIKKTRYDRYPYLHLGMPATANLKGIMKEYAGDVDDDTLETMCAYLTRLDPLQRRPQYAIWLAKAWPNTKDILPTIASKTIELLLEQADIEEQDKAMFEKALVGILSHVAIHDGMPLAKLKHRLRKY